MPKHTLFKSLRSRFLFIFLGFTTITLFVALWSIWFYGKVNKFSEITSEVEQVLTETLQLFKIEQNFFSDEIFSDEFYQKGISKDLNAHQRLLKKVKRKLYGILEMQGIKEIYTDRKKITEDIKHIIQDLENYEKELEVYVSLTRQRGFDQYGLEGDIRSKIHELEKLTFGISREDMLMLRRHEKDYIIQKDTNYAVELEKLYEKIQNDLIQNPQISANNKQQASLLLNKYLENFKKIVALEAIIGFNSREGVRGKMRNYGDSAAFLMEKLVKEVNQEVITMERRQFNIFLIAVGIGIGLSIFLSYYVSGYITQPITNLSDFIHYTVQKRFSSDITIPKSNREDEIGILTNDFGLMLKEIQKLLQEIHNKNDSLEEKNAELYQVNKQILESKERLAKVNSVKDTFFSIISHDLRSPLDSLSGFLQILQIQADGFTPDEIRTFSQDTQKSISRILDLLENLLQWSMSQTGEIEYKPQTINLQKIVIENTELYHRSALQKGIFLIADIPAQFFVKVDTNMMDFILRNLISNAIKFSKSGSRITIQAIEEEQDVLVSIQDEGVGMSKEHLNKLFQPEEHITTLGTNMEKGTGFGLLLCKNFIERNEGKIIINSELNKGTLIQFTLPKAGVLETQVAISSDLDS